MKHRIGSKKTLIDALQRGITPDKLPGSVIIGEGCFRKAYQIGPWVVKPTDRAHISIQTLKKRLSEFGLSVRVAPTTYVSTPYGSYVIQRKLVTIDDVPLDLHIYNIGFDSRGEVNLFDW